MNKDLFSPYRLGSLELANRMVMAPMTRLRAYADGLPSPLMEAYYAQRASAGLIITECTKVSEQGHGLVCSPGISTVAQATAWGAVTPPCTRRVGVSTCSCGTAAGFLIPPLRGGEFPVAPSAVA